MKQFLYLLGGGAISYLVYTYLMIYFALPIIAVAVSFSLALAFYKPNNKPFILMVEAFFSYILSPRLYIWKKIPKTREEKSKEKEQPAAYIPSLSESTLKDLSWSLDIKERDGGGTAPKVSKGIPLLKDL